MSEWLCILRPPRPTFEEDMTEDEARAMEAHFEYLKGLLAAGKLLLAGPASNPLFGVVVLVADSEEEAWELARGDPSVRVGVQTPELQPLRVALLAGR